MDLLAQEAEDRSRGSGEQDSADLGPWMARRESNVPAPLEHRRPAPLATGTGAVDAERRDVMPNRPGRGLAKTTARRLDSGAGPRTSSRPAAIR
jgi:hypothetical protein